MSVFADTSGLFALLVQDDSMHVRAKQNFESFAENNTHLLTSSYVILETMTLLQIRVGFEAVWDFHRKILPILDVVWADERWHGRAVQRLQLENKVGVSLTDCLGFEIMEDREIAIAFTFDRHFTERGFAVAESHWMDCVNLRPSLPHPWKNS